MSASPAPAAEEPTTIQATLAPPVTGEARPLAVLQKIFGFSDFRGKQQAVIRSLVDGRDAVVMFPTGAGKKLC
jgi:ATP-dependent DNA helicase RecQ